MPGAIRPVRDSFEMKLRPPLICPWPLVLFRGILLVEPTPGGNVMSLFVSSCRLPMLRMAVGFSALALPARGGDGDDVKPADAPAVMPEVAAGPDACGILPRSEVERILGSPVGEPEPGQSISSGDASMTACGWRTVNGKAGVSLGLRRGSQYRPDAKAFDTYASGFEENMGTRPEVQPMPGLGSAALWDATNHVLMVRPAQPGFELNVQPYLGTKVPMIELPEARAVAEAVLAQAAGR